MVLRCDKAACLLLLLCSSVNVSCFAIPSSTLTQVEAKSNKLPRVCPNLTQNGRTCFPDGSAARSHLGISSRKRTQCLAVSSSSILGTASYWIVSAMCGFWVEEHVVNGSGILVTLLLSATISATGCTGVGGHASATTLSDLVWGYLLPASLALLLLSMEDTKTSMRRKQPSTLIQRGDTSISQSIQQLAVPFLLASLGSVFGCMLSFWICHSFYSYAPSWLMAPREAQVALSCLAASFVGGSVNFFSTANAIRSTCNTQTTNTIVSSMAATDIFVMAIYFALIGSALSSRTMKNWFATDKQTSIDLDDNKSFSDASEGSTNLEDSGEGKVSGEFVISKSQRMLESFRAIILASSVAWAVVVFANWVQTRLDGVLPGTACAVIAVCTPVLKRMLQIIAPLIEKEHHERRWYNDMRSVSRPLSQVSFFVLFAAIGSTADLKGALRSGPACLVLSLLALLTHFFTTLVLSVGLSRWFRHKNTTLVRLDLEEVLVASNAAIGGPATAAAFCGRIKGRRSLEGITYAATFWGVVGYGIGTTIGVVLFRLFGLILD